TLLTAGLALVSMLTRYISAQQLYRYLIASTGQVGCLAWIVIGWCQYRFRRAVDRGEYPSSLLRYRSPFFPWVAAIVIVTNIAIIIGTWFSQSGMLIMLIELLFMTCIIASWFIFRPILK
ncbi:amino acid permease, partial [Klebsiella pneumoniae]